nr:uncharacterized protein LOC133585393 [Nerophis lumbriciformis]
MAALQLPQTQLTNVTCLSAPNPSPKLLTTPLCPHPLTSATSESFWTITSLFNTMSTTSQELLSSTSKILLVSVHPSPSLPLKSLSFSAAETLIHAFITSRLDYCNSILYGSSCKILNKFQYIQNSAARLLTHTRSREHITPVLQKLHWLPVPHRIHFKILLLTHKALHNQAPCYLTNLLHLHTPSRSLCSSDANLLPTTQNQASDLG